MFDENFQEGATGQKTLTNFESGGISFSHNVPTACETDTCHSNHNIVLKPSLRQDLFLIKTKRRRRIERIKRFQRYIALRSTTQV